MGNNLASSFSAWERRLTPPHAVAVIVGGIGLIGLIALAAALLPAIAAGVASLTAGGLYLTWCARLR